ncbi:Phthiocerol synthesis polyketide synthase type I PpsE [Labrenzia sp. THAF82]|uniref:type I polyketide synthase n=1 Tax=Labrenzia sp. THAF82 TaxID=2587861 RepID=UPI001267A53C|nr:type I polyketide synthase [Labrenzia sp. THAF82]QFT32220.1 Phthiocerol synthesis polyketide synthase type I PpsE [Labrenzia sp. THAF82]
MSTSTDIAVVGLAGRFPGAENIDGYKQLLLEGRTGLRDLSEDELLAEGVSPSLLEDRAYVRRGGPISGIEEFDAEFFRITPREAATTDPQHRLLLELAWEALEDAGCPPDRFRETGIFACAGTPNYWLFHVAQRSPDWFGSPSYVEGLLATDRDYISTRLSYVLGLEGPSLTVQTACSSSLVAVHLAVQSLLLGECDAALAGGVALQVPHRTGYLWQAGGYSSRSGVCRPFDARADGTLFGSGGGLVVLRPLDAALADGDRIYAVIKGSAVGNDGAAKPGFTAPSVAGQARTVAAALSVSGVPADKIGALEAHGTGTPLGDPIEIAALSEAFHNAGGARNIALGSVKGNIGHLDAAAGIAGLIKLVLARANGIVPASLNFQTPNPEIDFAASPFHVNTRARPWPARQPFGGINSLGIGGTNAHVIIGPAPDKTASEDTQDRRPDHETGPALLVLSSRTQDGLKPLAQRWSRWLAGPGRDHKPQEIAAAALNRRSEGPYRLALAGQSPQDWAGALAAFADTDAGAKSASGSGPASLPGVQPLPRTPRSVAFGQEGKAPVWIFSGQGGQSAGMAASLRHAAGSGPALETFLAALPDDLQPGLIAELLFGTGDPEEMHAALARPAPALLAHVAWQCAQTAFWRAHGLKPAAVLGVSVGEIAAAEAAGVFGLEGAAQTAANRARALEQTPSHGAMAVIARDAAGTEDLINRTQPGALDSQALWIAVRAGPESTVIAGQSPAMQQLEASLAETGLQLRPIACGGIASHGKAVEDAARIIAAQPAAAASPPDIPFQATTSGWTGTDRIPDFSAAYWAGNLAKPVDLGAALTRLIKSGHTDFLEIASRSQSVHTLDAIARAEGASLTLRQSASADTPHLTRLATLATFIPNKLANPVSNMENATRTRHIDIPKTPFLRKRHWIDPTGRQPETLPAKVQHPAAALLLGPPTFLAGDTSCVVFEGAFSANCDIARNHRVNGQAVLPAAAILEMAITCADLAEGASCTALEDIAFIDSILATVEEAVPLQMQLLRTDGQWTFCLYRGAGSSSAVQKSWSVAASGKLSFDDLPALPPAPWPNGQFEDILEAEAIYYGLERQGLFLGPDLKRIERAAIYEDVIAVQASCPRQQGRLPYALIDMAFQTLAAEPRCRGEGLTVPAGINRLDFHAALDAGHCLYDLEATRGGSEADIAVIGGSRQVICTLKGVTTKTVAEAETEKGWLYQVGWRDGSRQDAPSPVRQTQWVHLGTSSDLPGWSEGLEMVSPSLQTPHDEPLQATGHYLVITPSWTKLPAEDVPETAAAYCAALSSFAANLSKRTGAEKPRLTLVLSEPDQDTAGNAMMRGVLLGFMRTLEVELSELTPATLLVPEKRVQSQPDLSKGLPPEPEARWRDGRWQVPRLKPMPPGTTGLSQLQGAYLLTGVSGQIGTGLLDWLAGSGVSELLIVAHTEPTGHFQEKLASLRNLGLRVSLMLLDLDCGDTLEPLRAFASSSQAPLSGVFHLAGRVVEGPVNPFDHEALRSVMAIKPLTAWHIAQAVSGHQLKHFVLYSSMAGRLGAPGLGAHGAASAALTELAAWLRAEGIPASVVEWGPWEHPEARDRNRTHETMGFQPISVDEGSAALNEVLTTGPGTYQAFRFEAGRWLKRFPSLSVPPILVDATSHRKLPVVGTPDPIDWTNPVDARRAVRSRLQTELAAVIGFEVPDIAEDQPFSEMNLNSLMALELRSRLESTLALLIPTSLIWSFPTVSRLTQALVDLAEPDTSRQDKARQEVEQRYETYLA